MSFDNYSQDDLRIFADKNRMLENDDHYTTLAMFLRPQGSNMRPKCTHNGRKRAVIKIREKKFPDGPGAPKKRDPEFRREIIGYE